MAWQADDVDFCDDVTKYYDSQEAYRGIGTLGKVDLSVKDSYDVNLMPSDVANKYFMNLQKCLDLYVKKYPFCNEYAFFNLKEIPVIQKYLPGGGYKIWHCERTTSTMPFSSRHLVFMTYLNDVTDAGETEFFHQKIKIQAKKGLTVVWPADWTFTHRGIPSPTQEKMIVTGWLNYIE